MTKWEYLSISAVRAVSFWSSPKPWNRDVRGELAELGQQGWELVSITPRASVGGASSAGMTSEELWVFKRPLQRE